MSTQSCKAQKCEQPNGWNLVKVKESSKQDFTASQSNQYRQGLFQLFTGIDGLGVD